MTLEEKVAQLGSVWMGASADSDGVAPCRTSSATSSRRWMSSSGTGSGSSPGCSARARCHPRHAVTATPAGAAALALPAGVDAELPSVRCYGAPLLAAAEAGEVDPHRA